MTSDHVAARHSPATSRPWRSAQGVVAAVVVSACTIWRASVIGGGWFGQNDFLITLPTTSPTDTAYSAGLSPASIVIAQFVADVAPLNWALAAGLVVLVQTVALVILWHVLSRVLPGRWLRVPVLAFFAVTPLTLWSSQWWTVALQFWPAALAVLIALLAVLRSTQRGWTAGPWVAAAGTATALAFNERWVLAPVLLLGVAVAVEPDPRLRARLRQVVLDHPRIWATQGLVLVSYASVRALVAPLELRGLTAPTEVLTEYLRYLGALAAGGPWGSGIVAHASVSPPSLAVGLGLVALLALAAVALSHGGLDARLAWATLLVHSGLTLCLLSVQSKGVLDASLDLFHRYGADAGLVITLVVAAALRQVPVPDLGKLPVGPLREASPRAREIAVAMAATLAVVASASVSTTALSSVLLHQESREYVEAARAALRGDRTVVVLDSGVPAAVLSPSFGEVARASSVLARAPENPVFDLPSHRLRLLRDNGSLSQVALGGSVDMVPPGDAVCPRPVRFAGAVVPFQRTVPMGRWVVRLGYYTADAGLAVVDVAGQRISVPVQSGLNAVDIPVTATFDELTMSLEDPTATLCLATATVGVPSSSPESSQ
jgi:hypothetical protein